MKKTFMISLVIAFCGLLFVGCQFRPVSVAQITPESILYTQAAETVIVQLTKNAVENQGAQPQEPESTQQPAATATPGGEEAAAATSTPTSTTEATATQTTEPTATPSATFTAIPPSPTISGDDITKSLGGASWIDDFDSADNWSFTKDDRTSMEVSEGKAVLIAKNPDYYYGWALTWPKLEDFYLEISVKVGADCSGQDKYGLVFRSPKPSEGYLLGFSCDGKYRVWYYNGSDEVILKDWESNSKILAGPGQTNRVGIKAVGNRYTVYANGLELVSFTDDRQSAGSFGLMVGSVNTTNFTAYVEKLSYWDLKK